jgi:hypothetical protein
MTPRTIYLSRLLGLSLLVLAVAEIVQRSTLANTALAIVGSPPLLLVCGLLTLVAGVAIVVGHNVWRGGLMPVVVTILGWLLLFKGAALVVIPGDQWAGIVQASHFASLYVVYGILPPVLGIYLTVAGFLTGRSHSKT